MTELPVCWRSLLFVPAHSARFIEKAHERDADAIILDLEDAVPSAEKASARATLLASIGAVGRSGASVLVRVNSALRDVARDLEACVHPGLSGLVLPKVEHAGCVRHIAGALDELERERAVPVGSIRLVLQIETPEALHRLHDLAGCHERVIALALGSEDYSAAIGAVPDPETLLYPSMAVLHAARAAGRHALGFVDSIGAFSNLDALERTVRQARRFGFRGAMAVHPAQVPVLNAGFAPHPDELEWARRVIIGDEAARNEGLGAFQLDGRMIDAPVVRRARDILRMRASR